MQRPGRCSMVSVMFRSTAPRTDSATRPPSGTVRLHAIFYIANKACLSCGRGQFFMDYCVPQANRPATTEGCRAMRAGRRLTPRISPPSNAGQRPVNEPGPPERRGPLLRPPAPPVPPPPVRGAPRKLLRLPLGWPDDGKPDEAWLAGCWLSKSLRGSLSRWRGAGACALRGWLKDGWPPCG